MALLNPSVADFKAYFRRDFPYGVGIGDFVEDEDIVKAMQSTNATINQTLFLKQASYTLAYMDLSAHFLVTQLRASSQGINGQYSFLQTGRSAGPTSESSQLPQQILDDPNWSMYCKTNYGASYVFQILPRVRGAMFSAHGHTKP